MLVFCDAAFSRCCILCSGIKEQLTKYNLSHAYDLSVQHAAYCCLMHEYCHDYNIKNKQLQHI